MAGNDRHSLQAVREAARRDPGERRLSVRAMRHMIDYRDLGKVLAHERSRILRQSCVTVNDT